MTDILFFRKRETEIRNARKHGMLTTQDKEGYEVNNYFLRHPEMVLGTFAKEHDLRR
ncbi:MAG: hypothetical protein ACLRSW_10150 [Christensenellaceae bacterium]